MNPILKITADDDDRERGFEIDYLLSLTTEERFKMMFARSDMIKKMLIEHGYRKAIEVIKRQ